MEAQDITRKETLGFQAEVKQLLQLMIHSLYSHKEIFLRELISNASDACDKLRFEAMTQPALLEGHSELGISVAFDNAARTITVSDNGIGMSRTDVIAIWERLPNPVRVSFLRSCQVTSKRTRS